VLLCERYDAESALPLVVMLVIVEDASRENATAAATRIATFAAIDN